MKFTPLGITGAWLINLEKFSDERGFFARAYDAAECAAHGIAFSFAQINMSACTTAGTIRGLHYQPPPYAEGKLMRCIRGRVFEVMVDLRPDSATYLQYQAIELSADGRELVYTPPYCGHAYQALADDSEVLYGVSMAYVPGRERGIRWNDPLFQIPWPIRQAVIVSAKDQAWPDYQPLPAAPQESTAGQPAQPTKEADDHR